MRDAERIKNNWKAFRDTWPSMWMAFGQGAPGDNDPLTVDVWGQVQNIPAEAWPHVLKSIRELESKPRNWGKACKAFFYQWQGSHFAKTDFSQVENKPSVYKEGVIGPRMLHHRANGLTGWGALELAIQEYRNGDLNGHAEGRGPVFNTGRRDEYGTRYKEGEPRGNGPERVDTGY